VHDNHANAAALAVFVCARPPNPEEMKLAPPIIIPINPTSSALVNVHTMTTPIPSRRVRQTPRRSKRGFDSRSP
jgi:hypothetical protein